MIPLNKPYVNDSHTLHSVSGFVASTFPQKGFKLSFSARQGLWEIYRKIKNDYGSQTVAVSPLTCSEAIYPILEHGHEVLFVDINSESLNMDETLIPTGVDVVQAIHFGGNPQDMSEIDKKKPKLIVEDCAQGFGSFYKDRHVGNFCDFAAFSFMKCFYTLGGGLTVNKKEHTLEDLDFKRFGLMPTFYRSLKRYLEQRCSNKSTLPNTLLKMIMGLKPDKTTEVINNAALNKFILTSISRQLAIADLITEKRRNIAGQILSGLKNRYLIPQKISMHGLSNYLRLFLILQKGNSNEAIIFLRNKGIGANHLTQSYMQPYQERFDKNSRISKYIGSQQLPNYFNLHDQVISIPVSPALSADEINHITDGINSL